MKKLVELEEKSGKMIMIEVERAIVREASRWKRIRQITLGIVALTAPILLLVGGIGVSRKPESTRFCVFRDIFGVNVGVVLTSTPSHLNDGIQEHDGNALLDQVNWNSEVDMEYLIGSVLPEKIQKLDLLSAKFSFQFRKNILDEYERWIWGNSEGYDGGESSMNKLNTHARKIDAREGAKCSSIFTKYVDTVEPFVEELVEHCYSLEDLVVEDGKNLGESNQKLFLDKIRVVKEKAVNFYSARSRFQLKRIKIMENVAIYGLKECRRVMADVEVEEFIKLKMVFLEVRYYYRAISRIAKNLQEIVRP